MSKPVISRVQFVAFLVTVVAFVFLTMEAITWSPVLLDEYAHIPAGVSYWRLGSFELYDENPPLIQCLVAIPALLTDANVDYSLIRPGRSEWSVGHAFIAKNGPKLQAMVVSSRCIVLIVSVSCCAMIYLWINCLYGAGPALACTVVWMTIPSVIAFSGIATCDVGAATFSLAAMIAFWHATRRPSAARLALAGVALGIALSAKFITLMLCPAWLIIGIHHVSTKHTTYADSINRFAIGASFISITSLLTLNAIYAFEGSFSPLGIYDFKSRVLSGEWEAEGVQGANRFRGTMLGSIPVPVPKHYLLGLDSQRYEAEAGLLYLDRGRLVRGARWYTAFFTLSYKLPASTIIIIVVSSIYYLYKINKNNFEIIYFVVPAVLMLGATCAQTGLNWPVRYYIPALSFAVLAMGKPFAAFIQWPLGRSIIAALLLWNVVEIVTVRPNYLSYTNNIAMQRSSAHRHLHGSNYDWGQDLMRLRYWHDNHPNLRPIAVSYYGALEPGFFEIPTVGLPLSMLPEQYVGDADPIAEGDFFWVISANILNGMTTEFQMEDGSIFKGVVDPSALRDRRPVDRVGETLFVFHVTGGRSQADTVPLDELRGCLMKADRGGGIDAAP